MNALERLRPCIERIRLHRFYVERMGPGDGQYERLLEDAEALCQAAEDECFEGKRIEPKNPWRT